MKLIKIVMVAMLFGVLASCEDELKQPVDFSVEPEQSSGLVIGDTMITAPKGSKVTFLFTGDPDVINFSYTRFVPTSPELTFSTRAAWGSSVANSLSVFVSDEFKGLLLSDFTKDSVSIASHSWKDITAESNLPVTTNKTQAATLSLDEYRGKDLVLAFRYKPTVVPDWQPTWVVSDLKITNRLSSDDSVESTYLAATLGFKPFDMNNRNDAYRDTLLAGVWSTKKPAELTINRTSSNNALNHDWLISRPVRVPMGMTENSAVVGLKNMAISVDRYEHTFTQPGDYLVKFKAINQNYLHSDSAIVTIRVKINN